jgi:protein DJ-1
LSDLNADDYDAIILPGGAVGAPNMMKSEIVGKILKRHDAQGKLIGAICLAPFVLLVNGIGFGKRVTSYPKDTEKLSEKYVFVEAPVVQDGNLITSRGPGTVWNFTLKIAENLVGVAEAKRFAEYYLLTDFLDKNTVY